MSVASSVRSDFLLLVSLLPGAIMSFADITRTCNSLEVAWNVPVSPAGSFVVDEVQRRHCTKDFRRSFFWPFCINYRTKPIIGAGAFCAYYWSTPGLVLREPFGYRTVGPTYSTTIENRVESLYLISRK